MALFSAVKQGEIRVRGAFLGICGDYATPVPPGIVEKLLYFVARLGLLHGRESGTRCVCRINA
jgi:hypothetical protein